MIIGLNRGKPAWYPAKSARSRERILRHAAITCPRETLLFSPRDWLRRRLRAPQCSGRNPRAFGQGFQLRPHDRRMDATRERALREAAIGAAHDVFATDDLGQPDDALGNELRVLDDVGGMADHAGNQNLAGL